MVTTDRPIRRFDHPESLPLAGCQTGIAPRQRHCGSSSLKQSRPDLIHWLNSLETRKNDRHVSGLIIGMLGDEETTTDELDFVVRPLIRCAQQMGRNFIWHWMKSAMNDSDWLADGVNDLLSSKLAASNEDACDRFFLAR
jgi:hypothetical protein